MNDTGRSIRISLIVAVAIAFAWLLTRDGSILWSILRAAAALALTASAVGAVRSVASRSLLSAVLITTGILALGVGAAIAPPWVSKAGLGVTSISGIVLTLGGAALLALGFRDGPGRAALWAKVLGGVGIILLVGFTALTLSVAVAATNVPPTSIGDTPATRGIAYEDVELVTEDNIILAAWYVPSENGAAVVLLHGAGSTRSSVLDEMEVLASGGYGVLALEARGHGESEGRAMDFGWFGDRDIAPALDWLAGRPEVDDERIALIGMSMGGEEAIGAAASDRRVAAVVAEGATGRSAVDNAWLSDVYGFQGQLQRLVDAVRFGITDILTDAEPPIALRDATALMAPRPLLLITAGNVPDEAHAANYIQSGSPSNVEVWDVPRAGHTQGLHVDPAQWQQRVIGFLDQAILGE